MASAVVLPQPSRSFVLTRRRVYVLPTTAGCFFSLIIGAILLGGVNYNNAMAYALGFLLGAVLLITIIHTWRNLAGLELLGARAEPVFAGDTAAFQLSFRNPGSERIGLYLRPRIVSRRWLRRFGPAGKAFDVPAGAVIRATVPAPARQRGRLQCPRLMIESRFPLGLWRVWAVLDPEASVLVYPQAHGVLAIPAGFAAQPDGAQQSAHGSDDFAGLRNYQPGDPPRSIAWKALARNDQLEVKRFVGGVADAVWLRWDMVAGLPSVESRLQQLCRWVLMLDQRGIETGLSVPGSEIAPSTGPAHRAMCLRALAEFPP